MNTTETGGKSRNEEVDFHGQKRSNATHVSTTDPAARLYRKGPGKDTRNNNCYDSYLRGTTE